MCVQYINQYQPDSSKIYIYIHISLSSSMFLSKLSAQVTSFNRPIWSMFLNLYASRATSWKGIWTPKTYRCLGSIVTIEKTSLRMSHEVWSVSRSVCSGWFWNNDSFCWGFFGWWENLLFVELYGLSQQEILKNRSVKPQELESQMMIVQRGSSISVEDMWNSFRGGTTSVAWLSVQTPPVARGRPTLAAAEASIGGLVLVVFSNWKEPLPRLVPPPLLPHCHGHCRHQCHILYTVDYSPRGFN